jgi:hypothetical protein
VIFTAMRAVLRYAECGLLVFQGYTVPIGRPIRPHAAKLQYIGGACFGRGLSMLK